MYSSQLLLFKLWSISSKMNARRTLCFKLVHTRLWGPSDKVSSVWTNVTHSVTEILPINPHPVVTWKFPLQLPVFPYFTAVHTFLHFAFPYTVNYINSISPVYNLLTLLIMPDDLITNVVKRLQFKGNGISSRVSPEGGFMFWTLMNDIRASIGWLVEAGHLRAHDASYVLSNQSCLAECL